MKQKKPGEKLGTAVVAGLMLAVLAKGHHAGSGIPVLDSVAPPPAAAPAGGPYTRSSWAGEFLSVIGEPQTPCNIGAIEAWEAAEGGAWDNSANANPLNTTEPEPGDWSINSVGVKAYPSWQEGLDANATAIRNGLYGNVLAALRQGDDAQSVADAVASSPWGTEAFSANC